MNGMVQPKSAVSVSEMARMVGLSRARFYQLIGSAFPHPVYDVATRRPIYTEELQRACLEVRRRNCGIDGKAILFYASRNGTVVTTGKPKRKATKPRKEQYPEIVEGVRALGLTTVTAAQVKAAVRTRYNGDLEGKAMIEVISSIFLDLQRRNTGDSVR